MSPQRKKNSSVTFGALALLASRAAAIIGFASRYASPYTPTACPSTPIPTDGLFVAVGEGLWDNGAACGRKYQIRCASSAGHRGICKGPTVEVVVVDREATSKSRPTPGGSAMALNTLVYDTIANGGGKNPTFVTIEFRAV